MPFFKRIVAKFLFEIETTHHRCFVLIRAMCNTILLFGTKISDGHGPAAVRRLTAQREKRLVVDLPQLLWWLVRKIVAISSLVYTYKRVLLKRYYNVLCVRVLRGATQSSRETGPRVSPFGKPRSVGSFK